VTCATCAVNGRGRCDVLACDILFTKEGTSETQSALRKLQKKIVARSGQTARTTHLLLAVNQQHVVCAAQNAVVLTVPENVCVWKHESEREHCEKATR
jgi:hypothetical protein